MKYLDYIDTYNLDSLMRKQQWKNLNRSLKLFR